MTPESPAHRRNSFDALRIMAALMVVVGHAYALSGRDAAEPLTLHTGLGGFGELGVSIFFVISGFLVASSHQRLASLKAYLANRCLRILPALAVATILTAFVLGPAFSALAPGRYFSHAQTWLYPIRNLLLYPVTYALPGVFEANPYPGAVNGSLWTLRLEFSCYLLLPLLAAVGLTDRRGLTVAAVLALVAYLALLAVGSGRAPAQALIAARNGYLFLAGSALFAWRDRFRPQAPGLLAVAALLFLAGAVWRPLGSWLAVPVLPLLTIGLGLTTVKGVSGPLPFGDLSYGVYIYAFPVQQAWMQAVGPQRLPIPLFVAVTLACVIPLAAASWWLVERPALRLKRERSPAVAEPAPLPAQV